MNLIYPRSIGDDYPDYIDDERGYHYHAWEVISASELSRHEALRRAESAEELDALEQSLEAYTDLDRWVIANRRRAFDDQAAYDEHVDAILSGKREHPALFYQEIFGDMARRKANAGGMELAEPYIHAVAEAFPEVESALPWLRARLLLESHEFDACEAAYEELLNDSEIPPQVVAECCLELTEDLLAAGEEERARAWHQRAVREAEEVGYRAVLVDLELIEFPSDQPA